MNTKNIIVTGLPRSGTTLVCHLLNKVDNTIALHEPMSVNFSEDKSLDQICDQIYQFFSTTRQSILVNGTAPSLHVSNQVPDNHIGNVLDKSGLRLKVAGVKRGHLKINKPLSEDFTLCIKHNAVFTLLLKQLTRQFDCFAVIRNPLSLLASWNSVKLPINNGHIPMAEKQDPVLAEKLRIVPDKINRQLIIMSWFFDQFNQLNKSHIIKYEDLIISGGSSLQSLISHANVLHEPLQSKNRNKLYDHKLMKVLGEKLLRTEGSFWNFYEPDDINRVLEKLD